jgi:phage-related protein
MFDQDNLYLLHACKKQKGKAEQHDLNKARSRARKIDRKD